MAHWVLDPLGADEQRRCAAGAPGLAPRVPDPLRALVAPQNASGAPVVAHWVQVPLSVDEHRRHISQPLKQLEQSCAQLFRPGGQNVVASWSVHRQATAVVS